MNINSKLSAFAQNELVLSRNKTEREKIERSISQLEKILRDKLGNKMQMFLKFGSYTRNTILPRKFDSESDVDLMVVFDTSLTLKTPGTYRKWILDIIRQSYPNSISSKDFPAVKLVLNHIKFDIVPAYIDTNFWGDKTYNIPGKADEWRRTVPNDINESLKSKNANCGDNVIRNTIRLCKHWNASARYPFESYLMEKEILDVVFLGNENTYERFLKTLNYIAGKRAGVKEVLNYIKQYKGGIFRNEDKTKQFEWLQKLLPGLK